MSVDISPHNLVVIMSDEHQRNITGCYGNPPARTPNLDSLAARGVRFARAYTPSPICVPARAAFMTGLPLHRTGHWDNAFPYTGAQESTGPGWAARLRRRGYIVDAIGKLHFRRPEDDNGFRQEIDAMYVAEGIGEVVSCLRARAPHRAGRHGVINAGPGNSSYLNYDRRITSQASAWIKRHARATQRWVLFVSYVNPHPPFTAPPELFAGYQPQDLPLPNQWHPKDWPDHPSLNYLRRYFGWEEPLSEAELRQLLATYYAQCEFIDQQVGEVLQALEAHGIAQQTRIIYTSDHGAMLGARGLFGKFTLYDESAAIPLIIAGPDVPQNRVVYTPVTLLDCAPTILEAVGCGEAEQGWAGESLWQVSHQSDHTRYVLSEYHAAGSLHAAFMLCDGRYKYNHFAEARPHAANTHIPQQAQLFDLHTDPQELNNLVHAANHAQALNRLHTELLRQLDPFEVDQRAKADQHARVEEFGGEAAVLRRGLSNSPIPGDAPVFRRNLTAYQGD